MSISKTDTIIAVNDVELSSKWYQLLFGCKSIHGGKEFDVLVADYNEVLICLHKWGEHEHPTMLDSKITPGNGLILYFRTENMEDIRSNAKKYELAIEKDVYMNPNSRKREFTMRDPDGYYLMIGEYHEYNG